MSHSTHVGFSWPPICDWRSGEPWRVFVFDAPVPHLPGWRCKHHCIAKCIERKVSIPSRMGRAKLSPPFKKLPVCSRPPTEHPVLRYWYRCPFPTAAGFAEVKVRGLIYMNKWGYRIGDRLAGQGFDLLEHLPGVRVGSGEMQQIDMGYRRKIVGQKEVPDVF